MVETPNWVGAPVTGCNHDLAASASSASCSSPRAGGADNNGPTTENLRCAQRSWTGGLGDSLTDDAPFVRDLACEVGAHPRRRAIGAQRASSAGRTRAPAVPHIAPAAVVIGGLGAPTWPRRPRKRTEGGVSRRRQPSAAQHKLSRTAGSTPSSGGTPRGLRA